MRLIRLPQRSKHLIKAINEIIKVASSNNDMTSSELLDFAEKLILSVYDKIK
jgi:hypothetical protein